MAREKNIVLGCDDTQILSAILNNLNRISGFSYSVISATKISDVINIVQSFNPDLVILSFNNNQQAISDYYAATKKEELPLICFRRHFDNALIQCANNCVVFTYPMDYLQSESFLSDTLQSIFLLRSGIPAYATQSLAEVAIQQSGEAKELGRYVMELDQKVEMLSKIRDRITDLYPHVDDPTRLELISIVNSIKASANDTKLWTDFKMYFEQSNPDFLFLLVQKHPELTEKDLKYCCYLKMNMTNDDIKSLLGINQESVRTHKYRLKKKMSLSKDQDLRTYLREVDIPAHAVPASDYFPEMAQGRLF